MALSYQKTTKIDSYLQYSRQKSSYFVYICFSGEFSRLCKLTVLTGGRAPSPVTCSVNCGWWLQMTNLKTKKNTTTTNKNYQEALFALNALSLLWLDGKKVGQRSFRTFCCSLYKFLKKSGFQITSWDTAERYESDQVFPLTQLDPPNKFPKWQR